MYTTTNDCFTCDVSCDGCTASNSNSNCINCATGYYNNNGVCTACNDACSDCTGAGFTNCGSCASGYESGGSGICYLTCSVGDYLYTTTNECFTCHTACNGCSVSNSETNCVSCATHYYSSSSSCLECDISCVSCSNSGRTNCANCASDYENINGECLKICTDNVYVEYNSN